jgi:hypothetical protein
MPRISHLTYQANVELFQSAPYRHSRTKMGIPYSRQINAAFEQVTPLVAAGFKVLQTTRDISIILAVIQVLTVVFLFLILLALFALLYTVNPDLQVSASVLSYFYLPTDNKLTTSSA